MARSHSSLFPSVEPVVNDYQLKLHAVIDRYIRERSVTRPSSKGIVRARKIKNLIDERLGKSRGLTSEQLMWRMLEYIKREKSDDMAPFETSSVLRGMVLNHLCRYLRVNNSHIDIEMNNVLANELTMAKQSIFPLGDYPLIDDDERFEKAKLNLVERALTARSARHASDNDGNAYLAGLLHSIDQYETKAKKKWFAGDGLQRAGRARKKIREWCELQHLNENQLMCLIAEHLGMTRETNYGLFETSHDLRLEVAKGLCSQLKINEEYVEHELERIKNSTYLIPLFHSNFGPIYSANDGYLSEMKLRLKIITDALKEIARDEELTFSSFVNQ